METSVQLSGMHCESCVGKIATALKRLAGVDSVRVSLSPPVARLRSASPVDIAEIDAAVREAGAYRVDQDPVTAAAQPDAAHEDTGQTSFFPLFLILGYLLGTVVIVTWSTGSLTPRTLMTGFMGGFFLVFSFFKLLDLRGFAGTFRTYDFIARGWTSWGMVYPFIELALGAAYLTNVLPVPTNIVTLVLMLVGSAGVFKALLNKQRIRCACLGTVLKLPLTHVTLAEDVVMAVMAAVMLIVPHG